MLRKWSNEWKSANAHERLNFVLMGVIATGIWVHVVLVALGMDY